MSTPAQFPLRMPVLLSLTDVQTRLLNQYYHYCRHTHRCERADDLTPSTLLTHLLLCAVHADREFSAWVRGDAVVPAHKPP